jgi:hypothetical protein
MISLPGVLPRGLAVSYVLKIRKINVTFTANARG